MPFILFCRSRFCKPELKVVFIIISPKLLVMIIWAVEFNSIVNNLLVGFGYTEIEFWLSSLIPVQVLTIIVTLLFAKHPFEFTTLTEYVVVTDGETEIDIVVAPVFQVYELAVVDAVNIALLPIQINELEVKATKLGFAFTVTELTAVFDATHPNELLPVTEYELVIVGENAIPFKTPPVQV